MARIPMNMRMSKSSEALSKLTVGRDGVASGRRTGR